MCVCVTLQLAIIPVACMSKLAKRCNSVRSRISVVLTTASWPDRDALFSDKPAIALALSFGPACVVLDISLIEFGSLDVVPEVSESWMACRFAPSTNREQTLHSRSSHISKAYTDDQVANVEGGLMDRALVLLRIEFETTMTSQGGNIDQTTISKRFAFST